MSDENKSFTGLSDSEAKEFHTLFMTSFIGFTAVAVVAHVLAWAWRPWLPGTEGYTSALESAQNALMMLS